MIEKDDLNISPFNPEIIKKHNQLIFEKFEKERNEKDDFFAKIKQNIESKLISGIIPAISDHYSFSYDNAYYAACNLKKYFNKLGWKATIKGIRHIDHDFQLKVSYPSKLTIFFRKIILTIKNLFQRNQEKLLNQYNPYR